MERWGYFVHFVSIYFVLRLFLLLFNTHAATAIRLYGFPPFWEEDQDDMFEKIRKGDYCFPPSIPISDDAKDIIQKLLVVNPAKRLTAAQALAHPWVAVCQCTYTPLKGKG